LTLLSAAERQQLVVEWNGREAEYPWQKCMHELFEEQVERTPERTAVVYEGQKLSYRELNRRANQLGHYLRRQGVRGEERVGVCQARGVEMMVGVLGVWKAGGAYVPLEWSYPGERLRYMVKDAGVKVVVSSGKVEEGLGVEGWGEGVVGIKLDEGGREREEISKEREGNVGRVSEGENLAYVIYTSGSTGKAKGVGIEQRQLVNYVLGMVRKLERAGMKEGWKYATVTTLGADLGNTVLYPALVSGGELHVMGEERLLDGEWMGRYFEREGIDCLKIVPSHLVGLRGVRGG
jgi:non-ribosomal peptide synthetase component F